MFNPNIMSSFNDQRVISVAYNCLSYMMIFECFGCFCPYNENQ